MKKWIRVIFVFIPYLIYAYFAWIIRYARHPERYPLQKRWEKVQALVLRLFKNFGVKLNPQGLGYVNRAQTQYLVCNHLGFLDPLIMIAIINKPIIFISKIETEKMLFVGKLMKIIGVISLDRENLKQEVRTMIKAREHLLAGDTVMIFPEGTRNKEQWGKMLPFKAGAFNPPAHAKVDIVPIAIDGPQFVLPPKFNWPQFPIQIKIDRPWTSKDYQNQTTPEISDHLHRHIQNNVDELVAKQKAAISPYLNKKTRKLLNY